MANFKNTDGVIWKGRTSMKWAPLKRIRYQLEILSAKVKAFKSKVNLFN